MQAIRQQTLLAIANAGEIFHGDVIRAPASNLGANIWRAVNAIQLGALFRELGNIFDNPNTLRHISAEFLQFIDSSVLVEAINAVPAMLDTMRRDWASLTPNQEQAILELDANAANNLAPAYCLFSSSLS